MTKLLRIIIEGQLQSLSFRLQTEDQAKRLHLVGFVRTLLDGRVEIEAQGDEDKLEALLQWCQEKPHSTHLTNIMYRYDDLNRHYTEFNVRR